MVITYSLDQESIKIQVKITDCTDDTTFDVASVASQKMIFYLDDGTRLEKTADLVEDSVTSGEFYVQYIITSDDSFLTINGLLEYTAQITLDDGNIAELSQRRIAWIV